MIDCAQDCFRSCPLFSNVLGLTCLLFYVLDSLLAYLLFALKTLLKISKISRCPLSVNWSALSREIFLVSREIIPVSRETIHVSREIVSVAREIFLISREVIFCLARNHSSSREIKTLLQSFARAQNVLARAWKQFRAASNFFARPGKVPRAKLCVSTVSFWSVLAVCVPNAVFSEFVIVPCLRTVLNKRHFASLKAWLLHFTKSRLINYLFDFTS